MDIKTKREREKETVSLIIAIYCRKKHGGKQLCPDCAALDAYARLRSDKCPFMETKTFCSNCKVHCYKKDMREKIREVMRFSGPRMIFHHPIMAIRHVIESKKEKKQMEKTMNIKKIFWIVLGCIGVGLGAVGAVVPMLPAFPFLMLATFSFARSSEKLHTWFINTKLYKDNLEDYVAGRGMTWKTKIRIMVTVTLLMSVGFIMMAMKPVWIGCNILVCVWAFHIIYFIWGVKTIPANKKPVTA